MSLSHGVRFLLIVCRGATGNECQTLSTKIEGTDPQKEAEEVGGLSSKWQQQSGTEQQNSQGSRRWSSMGSLEYSEQHGVVRSDQVEGWGG